MARIRLPAYTILDGTLIAIDRVADQKPCYSGKHRRHGVNVQVIADPAGRLVWASAALPGSTHDLTAARAHANIDTLTSENVMTFAGKAYQGAHSSIRTPFKRHRYRPKLSRWQKKVDRAHARIRSYGERANATPQDLESPNQAGLKLDRLPGDGTWSNLIIPGRTSTDGPRRLALDVCRLTSGN